MPARSTSLARTAALLGDPARAAIVDALLAGSPLPSGRLARAAGIAPSTASEHLARLVDGGLLVVERHGRERRYALAGPEVADAVEALGVLAEPDRPAPTLRAVSRMDAMRAARTCYDHLAGRLGVALTERLVADGWLLDGDAGWVVGERGERGFAGLGIDVDALRALRRPLTRRCVDWTERRPHLAGALGAALATRAVELGWVERVPAERWLRVTAEGRRALATTFALPPEALTA